MLNQRHECVTVRSLDWSQVGETDAADEPNHQLSPNVKARGGWLQQDAQSSQDPPLTFPLDHLLKHSFANQICLLASARRMRGHVHPYL